MQERQVRQIGVHPFEQPGGVGCSKEGPGLAAQGDLRRGDRPACGGEGGQLARGERAKPLKILDARIRSDADEAEPRAAGVDGRQPVKMPNEEQLIEQVVL